MSRKNAVEIKACALFSVLSLVTFTFAFAFTLIILIFLATIIGYLTGNGVKLTLPITSDPSSLFIALLSNNINLVQLLKNVADDTFGSFSEVRLSHASVGSTTVHLGEGADTGTTTQVDFAGK